MIGMNNGPINTEIKMFLSVFQEEVLPGRTRLVKLLGRKCEPRILYTFLGFELKLGKKRITCPDLCTARYLKIFGELGLKSVHIPYDPSRTAAILPQLERNWEGIKELLLEEHLNSAAHKEKLRRIYRSIRQALVRMQDQ